MIRNATSQFQTQANRLEREIRRNPMDPTTARELAQAYNQWAWLVGNTAGDYEQAVAASRKSLELSPNSAGYLDTLARCLYATGDVDQAIATQRKALARDPHSGQLQRQLEFFQAAAAEADDE